MDAPDGNVLVIDDNEDILFAIKLLLKPYAQKITTLNNPLKLPDIIKSEDFDVIFLDMNFSKDASSGQEGFDWLNKILSIDPDAVVVFITAYGDAEKAVRAIKSGATDFVLKPWQNEKLLATFSSAIKLRRSRLETANLRVKHNGLSAMLNQPFGDFIGKSPEMEAVFTTLKKVARTDANVLITGENGTGKELVARAIHQNSLRKDDVFISVDLGSITESLFESELFGYEKGAFTDAKKDKAGRFEIANNGTLFLDEIGNLSIQAQTKILTVLERREIIRVGGVRPSSINVRLICATNCNLHDMIQKNEFRQDLLYRVNTVEIALPPLRERGEDISILADHFLEIYSRKYKKKLKGFTSQVYKKLQHYNWPGNVRELQHAIERAVILCDNNKLCEEDFILSSQSKGMHESMLPSYNLDEIEKTIILRVMKQYHGNITLAAKELGLTRTSLYRRMEKYAL